VRPRRSPRDRNRDGVRPVRLCERTYDKHDKPNSAARFARSPTRRRGAEHGRCERVGEQRRRERVERIVCLRRAVRACLHCALAEAAEVGRKMGDRV
jgi:hypothetical protein